MTDVLVTADNVVEFEVHHLTTEASTLGLKPGEWPERINTTLGNGLPFVRHHLDEEVAQYHQEFGCLILGVFND